MNSAFILGNFFLQLKNVSNRLVVWSIEIDFVDFLLHSHLCNIQLSLNIMGLKTIGLWSRVIT